jgi:hypothetical protein
MKNNKDGTLTCIPGRPCQIPNTLLRSILPESVWYPGSPLPAGKKERNRSVVLLTGNRKYACPRCRNRSLPGLSHGLLGEKINLTEWFERLFKGTFKGYRGPFTGNPEAELI